jgi:glyoxylase-like metal-dependent hydrolase (beta-lactamase superfamily II)
MKPGILLSVTALSLALLNTPLLYAAAAPAPVEAVEVAAGLYQVTGGGGANSVMLIGPEGALVVDSKLDLASAQAELALLDELYQGPLRYLVNTHVHPDHTGGNEAYGERGTVIIARDETRAILAAGQRGGPPAPAAALPTVTFDGAPLTLHINGETVVIRPMPGAHTTDNSIVQFVNANVFQLGDVFSTARYPVLAGGTFQGFIDTADQVLALANEQSRFIPGNGAIEDIAALRAWRAMLLAVRASVAALVAQGNSLEQVVAAGPTAAYDSTYGSPERMLPALYREISAAR